MCGGSGIRNQGEVSCFEVLLAEVFLPSADGGGNERSRQAIGGRAVKSFVHKSTGQVAASKMGLVQSVVGQRNGGSRRSGLRMGLAAGAQESRVVAPLLFACQDRHTAVVIAVIDCPTLLVQCVLPLAGGPHVLIGLLRCQPVDGDEMPHQFFVPRNVAVKQDMLDVVAVPAQCRKAAQPLAGCLFVILPDFVAV